MTPAIISFETAQEICKGYLKTLKMLYGIDAYVAGGFLRDAELGVEPKDIDIFFPARSRDAALTDQLAESIYGAFGQKGKLSEGFVNGNEYPRHLRVYDSVDAPADQYPIQLIISPVDEPNDLMFDLAICQQAAYYNEGRDKLELIRPMDYKKDLEEGTITIVRIQDPTFGEFEDLHDDATFERVLARHQDHLARIKAKYPDRRVVFSADFLHTWQAKKAYQSYLEKGLVENPREVLPTEAERAEWDAVRLQDGEAFAREVADAEARAAREAVRRAELDAFLVQVGGGVGANPFNVRPVEPAPEPRVVQAPRGRLFN